ncbi:ATP-binding protein [Microbulbifer sp. 2201CG32-9]|uniref:ATP-binding protein n=1 Tax=Microbulbifer sp. 2201CG32-9 TaxID=3232309 RepID=UPI00345C0631
MIILPKSLFWRLYTSIIGIFILSAVIFVGLQLYIFWSQNQTDFVDDTYVIANSTLNEIRQEDGDWKTFAKYISLEHQFLIEIVSDNDLKQELRQYQFQKNIRGINVYKDKQKGFLVAIYPIAKTAQKGADFLIISDTHMSTEEVQEGTYLYEQAMIEGKEKTRILTVAAASICIFVLLTGAPIYLTIKSVTRHISKLSSHSQALASGNLSVRADTSLPLPLSHLASSFNSMAEDLERMISEQQIMASAISHELRTPISKLQLVVALLAKRLPGGRELEFVQDIDRYIDELDALSNKVLTLSKLNVKDTIQYEEVDLWPLIKSCVDEFDSWFKEMEISMTGLKNCHLTGNYFYLKLLIDNLLKNATRYGNSRVLVTILQVNDEVMLAVEDDGPGIPSDQRETIFAPFSRVDSSRNKQTGGFGLGLALVESVVRRHKGKIDVSESGLGGAKFSILFPSRIH